MSHIVQLRAKIVLVFTSITESKPPSSSLTTENGKYGAKSDSEQQQGYLALIKMNSFQWWLFERFEHSWYWGELGTPTVTKINGSVGGGDQCFGLLLPSFWINCRSWTRELVNNIRQQTYISRPSVLASYDVMYYLVNWEHAMIYDMYEKEINSDAIFVSGAPISCPLSSLI